MDRPSCGHANSEGARFCGGCGKALDQGSRCSGCGADNPPGQRFCNACGEALAVGSSRPPPDHLIEKARSGSRPTEGERKQVTVLFADVMRSMELAESCDPEEWREVMDRFFAILADGVHLYEGTVDKFTGDGIMALFGAPIAHEDHAQRACFTALRLNERLGEFAAELRRTKGINFLVRIGINSGEVVVGGIGEDLAMEYTAVGHTVGLAQRMEQLAEPGKAYLTEHTAELVRGYLALEDLGEFEVKGSSVPLRVHELTGIGSAQGRLDISAARGFARFVGRDEEMAILEKAFEQAREGQPQVIGVVGEAGVGKSRLCHEFTQRWRSKGVPVYHTSGQAHTRLVPLMPVMRLMRSYFDITDQDSAQRARERIAGKLVLLDETLMEEVPLIFDFLAVSDADRPAPKMDPEALRRRLLAVMKRLIRAQSADQPGINLFEDLHWLDPASEAFLDNHVDAVQGTQSLTIVNFRPEYHAGWMSKDYYGQIALVPLGPEAVAAMIDDMVGSDPSLGGLPAMISERTGGNPFFVEEVMRSLVEAGSLEGEEGAYRLTGPVDAAAVPASVQVILGARIDRLDEEEKTVLQAAAVVGKEFPHSVLARVVGRDAEDLDEILRRLVASGFVYEQEIYPEQVFVFKHPLTQEVAYGSQLGERRAADHAATARAIVERHPESLDEQAALLAHHSEAAGDALEAARWHCRAATWTGTRDPTESQRHWLRVRELTDTLPADEETMGMGIQARVLALQYGWRLGISHEEAASMFEEAEAMASKAGAVIARASLLSVYGGIRGVNDGDAPAMAELTSQAIALAEETGDPEIYVTVAGSSYGHFLIGENRRAVEMLDRTMELLESSPNTAPLSTVVCPMGYCLVFKGGFLVGLGELEEARELISRGLALCREEGDLETAGWGHMWAFWTDFFSGDRKTALGNANQAVELAEETGSSFSRIWAWTALGGARLLQGEWDEATLALERAIAMSEELRTAVEGTGWRLCWLAEAQAAKGAHEHALSSARAGLEAFRRSGQPASEAMGLVTLSRVLTASGGASAADEASDALRRSVELAERTGCGMTEPFARVELSALAGVRGDDAGRERELQEAHRLFSEFGASGHAERVARELPASAR